MIRQIPLSQPLTLLPEAAAVLPEPVAVLLEAAAVREVAAAAAASLLIERGVRG